MNVLALSGLPLLVVGERALGHWGFGSATNAGDCEIWAWTDAAPPACCIAPGGAVAQAEVADGHAAFHWNTPAGHVTARIWATGTSGALFVQANAGAPTTATPAGLVPVARPTSLLLMARAALIEPEDWLARIRAYHDLRAHVRDSDALPTERAAYERRAQEIAARAAPVHRVSMRVPNETFFRGYSRDEIRLYNHDDLHRTTCYYDIPLYLKLKDEPELAYIPKCNFDRLGPEDQVRLVREECFAIALERVVIPAEALGVRYGAEDAYLYALHRICTDLATGWFRDFAIDRFPEAERIETDFVDRFRAAVAAGRVRTRNNGPISAAVRAALADNLDRVARRQRLAGLPGAMPAAQAACAAA